jgi:hypothetical protein
MPWFVERLLTQLEIQPEFRSTSTDYHVVLNLTKAEMAELREILTRGLPCASPHSSRSF